jgi:hypothetical protein
MKRVWLAIIGKERLSVVFWLYYVVGLAITLGVPAALTEEVQDLPSSWGMTLVFIVVGYVFFAHVLLWMCAFNSGAKWLGYIIRVYIVGVGGYLTWSFLSPQPPQEQPTIKVMRML